MFGNAVLGAPFFTSIFDPNTSDFMSGGTISFFEADKVTPKPVYPSPDTEGSPLPNPLTLNSIAAVAPIYYLTDAPYWIVVTPATPPGCSCEDVDPTYTFFYFPGKDGGGSIGSEVFNYLTNGQFLHIVPFNKPADVQGKIQEITTEINQAWWLDVDSPEENTVLITYHNVVIDELPGNPINLMNLQVTALGASMQFLDLYQYIGQMNMLQGQDVTVSLFGKATNGVQACTIQVLVETNDQNGNLIQTPVGTITLTNDYETIPLSFAMPVVSAGQPNAYSYTRIIFRYPLLTITSAEVGNMMLQTGVNLQPEYIDEPYDLVNAKTFANDFNFPCDDKTKVGEAECSQLTFMGSTYQWTTRTGEYWVGPLVAMPGCVYPLPPEASPLDLNGYYNGIPFSRLFNAIGNDYGVPGLKTSVSGSTITATALGGGLPDPVAWNAYSSGFSITQTVAPYAMGVTASRGLNSNQVVVTFNSNYAPNRAPNIPTLSGGPPVGVMGSWYYALLGSQAIRCADVNIGSPSTPAVVNVIFNSANISDYRTRTEVGSINFIEYSSATNSARGGYRASRTPLISAYSIFISVDGGLSPSISPPYATQKNVIVPFISSQSLQQNIRTFINTVNTPYQYTVYIPAIPTAGAYFTYGPPGVANCIWYKVGGVGTEPVIPGVTNFYEIDLTGTELPGDVAVLTSDIMAQAEFYVPGYDDLPDLPDDSKAAYGIFL